MIERKRAARPLLCEALESRLVLAAPVAIGDSFEGQQDKPLVIDTAVMLANDTAANRESLSVALSLSSGPTYGTLTIRADGKLLYQPKPDFYGHDHFSYHAEDGEQFSITSARVTIDVKKYVPPMTSGVILLTGLMGSGSSSADYAYAIFGSSQCFPYASNDNYEIAEDTPLVVAASGVLKNDFSGDRCNDAIVAPSPTTNVFPVSSAEPVEPSPPPKPLEAELATPPAHGTVTLNPDGSFAYLPSQDYFGDDRYVYRWTNNGGLTRSATVFITITPVNDAPVAADDRFVTESGRSIPLTVRDLLANDRDVDNAIVFPLLPLKSATQHGTLTLSSEGLLYTPELGYQGPDQFSYCDTDGELFSRRAVVSLELTAPVRHNQRLRSDVNSDDHVSPLDALLIVNFLNAHRSQPVASAARLNRDLLDVNGDGFVAASDCLDVVNELNARRTAATQASESQGEGEAAVVDSLTEAILAFDLAHAYSGNSRRRR